MFTGTVYHVRENSGNIPYDQYFEIVPCENWSLRHYVSFFIDNYANVEKKKAHHIFFSSLHDINNNIHLSQEIRDVAQKLISDKDVNIPLQANGSVNILKVVKTANVKVPRESTYDAEMYRILYNWLAKVHGFEITGQWHLKAVSDDGYYRHSYCDLTIKKPDSPYPEAVIEVLATESIPKLEKHFEQVLKYADRLCPKEIWVVHFSRENSVTINPHWPNKKLQDRGLNVIYF
ncbi:1395_t:CDS:2 [Cetraspora pellucida]|uniref:1395_t:CDS:1 n=1 Tax=Cetraspora pellucida TaxID=1433469 RepID=A0ACA9LPX8_9GLOM|nr:1395_t:CDS:2 [Cetraspora pellucida]